MRNPHMTAKTAFPAQHSGEGLDRHDIPLGLQEMEFLAGHRPHAGRLGQPLVHGAAEQIGDRRKWVSGHACARSEEHTSELQSLMRISYAVFCLKKKIPTITHTL